MKTSKTSGVLLWSLVLAWFTLMAFLSSQPGPDTAQSSLSLTRFLVHLLHLPESGFQMLHLTLRASAHFVGFFILGGLAHTAMHVTFRKKERMHLWAFGFCGLIGVLDEVKKVFIPGRHLSWDEAGLNAIGAWCGILLMMAVTESISTARESSIRDKGPASVPCFRPRGWQAALEGKARPARRLNLTAKEKKP